MRLGEGDGLELSPDGKWILTVLGAESKPELVLVPSGAGELQRLGTLGLDVTAAALLPDGKNVLLAARAPSEGTRLYVRPLSGGALQAISPEGVTAFVCRLLSPDGREAFATGPDGRLTLYPLAGGEPRIVPGTTRLDVPIRWTPDGRGIFV